MRLIGKTPWERNPNVCGQCIRGLRKLEPGGAEVALTLLFADVRGSTALAESMTPRAYAELIQRFFRAASDVFARGDAIIDQLVGDEAIGLFLPGYAGTDHAFRAVDAAWQLLRATGHGGDAPPWIPVGAGVHTGVVYVGSIASGAGGSALVDFTATGDAVNVTARLASAAGPGEILVSEAAAREARLAREGLEVRELHLKGKSDTTRVHVVARAPERAAPGVA